MTARLDVTSTPVPSTIMKLDMLLNSGAWHVMFPVPIGIVDFMQIRITLGAAPGDDSWRPVTEFHLSRRL